MTGRLLRSLAGGGLTLTLLTAAPVPASAAPATSTVVRASRVVRAAGDFTVTLDVTSIQLQPVGTRCLLTVDGTLDFTGTLTGTAAATTRALEDATCPEVLANPPGTFADVFRSTGTFEGTVDGRPAEAGIRYAGRTAVGGSIDAVMVLTGGVTGALHVNAQVAVGGSYRGVLVEH